MSTETYKYNINMNKNQTVTQFKSDWKSENPPKVFRIFFQTPDLCVCVCVCV